MPSIEDLVSEIVGMIDDRSWPSDSMVLVTESFAVDPPNYTTLQFRILLVNLRNLFLCEFTIPR